MLLYFISYTQHIVLFVHLIQPSNNHMSPLNKCFLLDDHHVDLFLFALPLGAGLEKDGLHHMVNKTRGIITLYRHQKAAFAITSKRGPTPKAPKTSTTELPPGSTLSTDNDEVSIISEVQHLQIKYKSFTIYVFVPYRAGSHFLFREEGQNSP